MIGRVNKYHNILWLMTIGVILSEVGNSRADYLIADLSDHRIAITSGFTGAEVLLFGTRDGQGDVVVILRGPAEALVVRRKARTAGLWLNRDEVVFADAPGYYAVAASRPLADIAPKALFRDLGIGFANLNLSAAYSGTLTDPDPFRDALLRNMTRLGLYSADPATVIFVGGQLFRTTFNFPANVPTGLYHADIYLISLGVVVSRRTTALQISKSGFEAAMFQFARFQPLAYGLVAVAVALMAGWIAGMVFRKG